MTSPTMTDERREDFITEILRYIDNEQADKAVQALIAIEEKPILFDVIYQLLENLGSTKYSIDTTSLKLNLGTITSLARANARELASDFANARDLASDLASDLARDLALVRELASDLARELASALARDLVHDLANARDLASDRDLARYFTRDRDLARDLATYLARDLARASYLARASASYLARDLALASYLASDRDLARDLSIVNDFQLIAQVLNNLILGIPTAPIVQEQVDMRYRHRLAEAVDDIFYLNQQAAPILTVIADVLLHEMQDHAIPITLEGVDSITADILSEQIAPFMQAIQIIQEVHTRIAGEKLKIPHIVQIHNATPKIEILGIGDAIRALNEVLSFTPRKDEKKLRDLEQDKLVETEANLRQIFLIQADEYLKSKYPDLTDEQRRREAPEIAQAMMLKHSTRLEYRIGWHNVSRPKTLPK